ncbi:hypothetical protein NI17_019010 [Thermobifida halotolerans]|uniref:Uncharacterized protein n=1 Tax=Thermobifida halotolerans TaxID=483545 RepID=A0A399FVH9_9ACTN|nr:hypothetical protein [Thermobifida halotolerans]UOE18843.1 hypothetical protein NI17_019010 [Thermobifida halotolerans]
MSAVSDGERQPDLVERIADGLRSHPRVILDAFTDRDQQRAVAAGRVAGKHLKRATRATATGEGVLVEFDDIDGPYQEEPETEERPGQSWGVRPSWATYAGPSQSAVRSNQNAPGGRLPQRVPGTGPRPGAPVPKRH